MSEYIKSPLNYTGGKYKLLPSILPLFPTNIDTFVDLFCGGFNVGINVEANKIVGNDVCSQVIDIYRGIQKEGVENSLKLIENLIIKYNLDMFSKEGYYNLRNFYNIGNSDWYIFYTLVVHSFNHQIRFNNKGEYNMPFGRERSYFNPKVRDRFIEFSKEIQNPKYTFTSHSFEELDISKLTSNDFVYIDPPYLISCATYNENGGWNEEQEIKLLNLCDELNKQNIRFALSNVLEHKGMKNNPLIEWSKNYNIHYLNYNYNNCNYQRKNKECKTIEVLITNY